jgi:hypothetical protein
MKLIFIFAITILMISAIGPVSAKALDFGSWENTWHKIIIKWNSVCEEFETQKLVKLPVVKGSFWIFIETYNDAEDNFSAFLFGKDENGAWGGIPFTLYIYQDSLETPLGTASDVILESDVITEVDDNLGYEIDFSFVARLTGKEKLGALKIGKLKSVNGTSTIILTDLAECVASVTISGTLKKAPPAILADLETESARVEELETESVSVKDNMIFVDFFNDCLNLLQK